MPSLRQISTSRIIQLKKANVAQMVMACHRPPLPKVRRPGQLQGGWIDGNQPRIPCVSQSGTVKYQQCAKRGEKDRRDTEKADIEGTNPEIEQITPNQRSTSNAVFSLEAEQCHLLSPS